MDTPEPRLTRSVDASAWSAPLPEASGFEHLVIETPGLRTHVAAIGAGEPVVLLHGFPQHWWQWHAIAPVIAAGGYRVICPDLRGAGWTVADDPRIERETRLRDLLALFDVLHIERAHLVSHDMGVITAMQLTYDQPERVRTAVQLSVPPGFMKFSPKVLPGFRHLPRFVWHRPGASLRGVFSEAYVAHPMSEAAVEAHLAPMRRPDIDGAVRPLTPRHGPARRHAHESAASTAAGVSRCRPSSYSAAATAPGPRSSWGVSAAIRSGTPIASSSPTSTTQRISSPTTPPPRSPTSHSTGSNEPHDGWLGHVSTISR